MFKEILSRLSVAGAPEEILCRPVRVWQDENSDLHASDGCLDACGEVEQIQMQLADLDTNCPCLEAAVDDDPDLRDAVAFSEELHEIEIRLAGISKWRTWFASNGRQGFVAQTFDILAEVEKLLDETLELWPEPQPWQAKWLQKVSLEFGTTERDVREEVFSDANRNRLVEEAIRTILRSSEYDDIQTYALQLAEETVEMLGGRDAPMSAIEEELRGAYATELEQGKDEKGRQKALHDVLVKWRPEELPSTLFCYRVKSRPKADQTVQEWLEELWDEDVKDLAVFIERIYTRISNRLRRRSALMEFRYGTSPNQAEVTLLYRKRTTGHHEVLELPEGLARVVAQAEAERLRCRPRELYAPLKKDDGPHVAETAIGLFDPDSRKLNTLKGALEAARMV